MKPEGAYGYKPRIVKLGFSQKGRIEIYLRDKRIISIPKGFFSDLKKLSSNQLKKWTILSCGEEGDGFMFDDCDEVYHIEQVLGKYKEYAHNVVNEPPIKYKTKNIHRAKAKC